MADNFDDNVTGLESPALHAFDVTPSNTVDLPITTRGFYVGVGGNVKVDTAGGETVTFVGCLSGSYHPIRAKRIYATGTTATNLIGLY